MPVTKSAKRAQRIARRRHQENTSIRAGYKSAVKAVRKAVEATAKNTEELLQAAHSQLDKAAKKNVVHRNKAARLKSRLAKKLATGATGTTPTRTKSKAKKSTPKKSAKKK